MILICKEFKLLKIVFWGCGWGSVCRVYCLEGFRLLELVDLWYKMHGCTLKDHKYRLSHTMAIVHRLGDPKTKISPLHILPTTAKNVLKKYRPVPSTTRHDISGPYTLNLSA
ncbi:phage integrase [Gilvimarinus gilvus]|uniref:phage integrase n=1 Tax=Gilvimarinus gilvus TaxID=3058038 RepID=UPI003F8C5F8F